MSGRFDKADLDNKKTELKTQTKVVKKGDKEKGKEEDPISMEKVAREMLTASWAVDPIEIMLIEPALGEGTFAKVYKGLDCFPLKMIFVIVFQHIIFSGTYRGQTVAVKVLKQKVAAKQLIEFQNEFAVMSAIRSPHVVFFYGACINPTLYMVHFFSSLLCKEPIIRDSR